MKRPWHIIVAVTAFGVTCLVVVLAMRWASDQSTVPTGVFLAKPAWTYRTSDTITSSLGKAPGRIYVRTENSLVALSTQGGVALWRSDSRGDKPLSLAPMVVGDAVIVTEADSRLAAYDSASGRLLWRTAPLSVSGLYAPRIEALVSAGDLVVVARFDWSLAAYKLGNGEVAWEDPLSSRASLYLAATDSTVYLGMGDVLNAYDAASGTVVWQKQMGGLIGPMTEKDDVLYVTGLQYPSLLALDLGNHQFRWRAYYEQVEPFEIGCLAQSDSRLMIAERKVIAVSEANGLVAWTSKQTGRLECPVVLGSNLYVRNTSSTLFAFDINTGAEVGTFPIQGNTPMKDQPNRGPVVVDGMLITPTGDHEVLAFHP